MKSLKFIQRLAWSWVCTVIFLPGLLYVTGVQAQVSQERQVGAFKGIENRGSVDLYIYQGTAQRVLIEADESVIDKVDTWVDGDVLVIDLDNCPWNVKILKAHITVKDLELLVVNGSGDLKTETPVRTEVLETKVNGSGDISLEVFTDKLDVRINGSGDATIKGDARNVYLGVSGSGGIKFSGEQMDECVVKLTGSGDIELLGKTGTLHIKQVSSGDVDASDLVTSSCIIEKSGSGDTSVYVDGDLSVVSSGSGDVYYRGNTRVKNVSVSGSGDVRKIN